MSIIALVVPVMGIILTPFTLLAGIRARRNLKSVNGNTTKATAAIVISIICIFLNCCVVLLAVFG